MLQLRRDVMIPRGERPGTYASKATRRLSRVVNGDVFARQQITIQHAKNDLLLIAKEWYRR